MVSIKVCAVLLVAFAVLAEAKVSKKLAKRGTESLHQVSQKRQLSCSIWQFECKSGQCVEADWACDTIVDCWDGSDEVNCPTDCSGPNQFPCNNGNCVAREYRCDGDNDCGDLTDEHDCHKEECGSGKVKCDNHLCIESTWVCDGENDCGDGSDERNCTGSCADNQFLCLDGSRCVDDRWVCDGWENCIDASDELHCQCDNVTEFKCVTGRCININWRCDGEVDCRDASDEMGCPTIHPSLCHDMLTVRDCALMNETTHPICLNPVDGHKFCRKFCEMCD